ncbi:MAG: acylphosphatase [bacterium]
MPENRERLHLLIRGRVQGVWYRASARERAVELGLTGWVRNGAGGEVELVAEGPPEALERLREWCREGPPLARVSGIERKAAAPTGEFMDFEVR